MTVDDEDLVRFGGIIRSLRSASGESQEGLAASAGLDRTYLSDVERGRRNLGLRNIHALARALHVPPADLFPAGPSSPAHGYRTSNGFRVDCGFLVTGHDVLVSVLRTNLVLAALPLSLYRTVDFKAQSGMVGAVFAAELSSEVDAIPNPIEKGHPDIVPRAASTASESELRNYPHGLEVKSTVGSIKKGVSRLPGEARIDAITNVTWQAHHTDVRQLMGMTWDYVGGTAKAPAPPAITGVFFSDELSEDDWGRISGTTGRNTKVTGMRASGRALMARKAAILIDDPAYLDMFRKKVGRYPSMVSVKQ